MEVISEKSPAEKLMIACAMIRPAKSLAEVRKIIAGVEGVEKTRLVNSGERRVESGDDYPDAAEKLEEFLLDSSDPSKVLACGFTPLMIAAARGNVAVMDALLSAGAKINIFNVEGYTALTCAAKTGRVGAAEYLMSKGIATDVGEVAEGNALTVAIDSGYGAMVDELIASKRFDIDKKVHLGNAALHVAAENNDSAMLDRIVKAGANINLLNEEGDTPLIAAVRFGCEKAVKTLLAAGADVEITDRDGKSPLVIALATGADFDAKIAVPLIMCSAGRSRVDEVADLQAESVLCEEALGSPEVKMARDILSDPKNKEAKKTSLLREVRGALLEDASRESSSDNAERSARDANLLISEAIVGKILAKTKVAIPKKGDSPEVAKLREVKARLAAAKPELGRSASEPTFGATKKGDEPARPKTSHGVTGKGAKSPISKVTPSSPVSVSRVGMDSPLSSGVPSKSPKVRSNLPQRLDGFDAARSTSSAAIS